VLQLSQKVDGLDQLSYTVIRRFSDFVWLRDEIHRLFPYLLAPPLPDKQAIGRLNTEFVEVRARALQRWLDKLTAHDVLATCDPLLKFVSLPNEAMTGVREGKGGVGSSVSNAASSAGSSVVKMLKGAASSISTAVSGGSSGSTRAGKSGEDLSFEEVETYLFGTGPLLINLYNNAAALAGTYRDQAQLLLDYGAALRALGSSEGEALGASLSSTGLSTWAASTASYEQAVQETELWVERLADLVRGIKSVRSMLSERSRVSAVLADSLAAVERLRSHITALGANPSASAATEKAKLDNDLVGAQNAVTEARAHYDKVAAAVIAEVERYRGDMRADFRAMLLDFANIQIRNQTKLAQAWERIIPDCKAAIPLEGATPLMGAPVLASAALSLAGSGDPTAPAAPPAHEENAFAAY
jgi:sorting nexin-1/2